MSRMYEPYDDENYANVIKNMCTGKIYSDAGEIADLLNQENVENVKLKLVLGMIIEDLEKGEGNEKYVDWIKSEVDGELFSKKGESKIKLEGMPLRVRKKYRLSLKIRERLFGRIAMATTEVHFKIPRSPGEKGPVDKEIKELINNLEYSRLHEVMIEPRPHELILIVR